MLFNSFLFIISAYKIFQVLILQNNSISLSRNGRSKLKKKKKNNESFELLFHIWNLSSIHACICIIRFKFIGDSSHDRNRGPDQDYEITRILRFYKVLLVTVT